MSPALAITFIRKPVCMPEARRPCRVLVCTNHRMAPSADSCGRRGGEVVLRALREAVSTGLLPTDTTVEEAPCLGHCTKGPNVRVVAGPFLHAVNMGDGGDGLTRVAQAVAETARPTDEKTAPQPKHPLEL